MSLRDYGEVSLYSPTSNGCSFDFYNGTAPSVGGGTWALDNNPPSWLGFNAQGWTVTIDLDLFFTANPTIGTIYLNASAQYGFELINSSNHVCLNSLVWFDLNTFCLKNSIPIPVSDCSTFEAQIISKNSEIAILNESLLLAHFSSLPSLNGNGCEFLDSTQVKVVGRSIVYTVARSYMGLVSDNSYTVLYDCIAFTGETLTVPEALLTRYIAPVTTP